MAVAVLLFASQFDDPTEMKPDRVFSSKRDQVLYF